MRDRRRSASAGPSLPASAGSAARRGARSGCAARQALRNHRSGIASNISAELVVTAARATGPRDSAGVVADVAKHRMLASRRQRIAEQTPAAGLALSATVARRSGYGSNSSRTHLAAIERRAKHLRRALPKRRHQIPELDRIKLDRRRRAEDHAAGLARRLDAGNAADCSASRRFAVPRLPREARALCASSRMTTPNDFFASAPRSPASSPLTIKPGRHDADAPRAFCDQRRIALLGQRPPLAVEPAFLLRRPHRRRDAELVLKLFLPLPDQCRGREDQHRPVVEHRQHQRRRRHRQRLAEARHRRRSGSAPCRAAGNPRRRSRQTLLPRAQDLAALVDRPIGEHRLGRHAALASLARFLDRAILVRASPSRRRASPRHREDRCLAPRSARTRRAPTAPRQHRRRPRGFHRRGVSPEALSLRLPTNEYSRPSACSITPALPCTKTLSPSRGIDPDLHSAGREQIVQAL